MQNDYKADFPILKNHIQKEQHLIYFDNAATTQKPQPVIDALKDYLETSNANPHRGAYQLSGEATLKYEQARASAARLINAKSTNEIVFTKNTTDSLNLVAYSWAEPRINEGDEILISIAEHHSNLLPWQTLAKKKGATLKYVYTDESGCLSLEDIENACSERTKIVSMTHISNVLGVVNPVREIGEIAHKNGAVFIVDGAQSVPHIPVDVQEIDVDFLAFSGHKMLGPDGIGVLYGKSELLKQMEPVTLGGGIVEDVQEQSVSYLDAPLRFEAGTQNVLGAVGLNAAIDYLSKIGFETITKRERELTLRLAEKLSEIPDIIVYGDKTGEKRTGIISFNVKDVHPHDVASILDDSAVAIRAGHHCAQPLMGHLGTHSCCRASVYFYNDLEEVDRFAQALKNVRGWLF